MQSHARVGGALSIVMGAFGILELPLFILIAGIITIAGDAVSSRYPSSIPENFIPMIVAIFILSGVLSALFGLLAIAGGVCALKKTHWSLALAGAILGTLTFFPFGIPAIILLVMGKKEFQNALSDKIIAD
jgi:hypothetical protein